MRLKPTSFVVFASLLLASGPALSCERTLQVAVPDWMTKTGDYGSIQDTIRQAADGSDETCLTFVPSITYSEQAVTGVKTGALEAALVPASTVAAKHREFLPVISGYRFKDAHALQDAFKTAKETADSDGSLTVLGLATGKPAFPVFRSDAFKNGPDFASKFAIVPDPDTTGDIRADALLSTPARFGAYMFVANPDALDRLDPSQRSKLDGLIDRIGSDTADRSDSEVRQFLDQARDLGMQSYDLGDSDRQELLRGIEELFSGHATFDSTWVQQCTEGSCPCAGTNLCADNCCASQ